MMKKNLIAKLLVLTLAVTLVVVLFACSPRNPEDFNDDGVTPGGEIDVVDDVRQVDKMDMDKAKPQLEEALDNYKKAYPDPGEDPEWFVIDTSIDYEYDYFGVDNVRKKDVSTKLTIDLKMNVNLKTNSRSEVFIEVRDDIYGRTVLGMYYFDKTLYVNVAGNEFYTREMNFTEIGKMIYEGLAGSGMDITMLAGGILLGSTGIETIDGFMPLIQALLFSKKNVLVTQYNQNEEQEFMNKDIAYGLEINSILGILKTRIPIGEGITISWTGFGLPDFDPLMRQLIGFGLSDFINKNWPKDMHMYLSALTEKMPITQIDDLGEEFTEDLFVFKGLGIDIDTTETVASAREEHRFTTPEMIAANGNKAIEEFSVNIKINPLRIGAAKAKTPIKFTGYGFGAAGQNTRYEEAGIGNLGVSLSMFVEADEDSQITLNDILGDLLNADLGALGNMPIQFPHQTRYEFTVDLKVGLDFFNPLQTKAEASILMNGVPIIRVYIGDNTLYLNFSALTTLTGQFLPNIKLIGFSINSFLSSIMPSLEPFLNPDYVAPVVEEAEQGPDNAEGEEEEAGGLDIMALLSVITENLTVPGRDPSLEKWIISIDLDNRDINNLLSMFLTPPDSNSDPEAEPPLINPLGRIGIHSARVEIDQKDPLHSLKIKVLLGADGNGTELTNQVGFGITLNELTYFKEPAWDNYEMVDTAGERESYTNATVYRDPSGATIAFQTDYNLLMTGDVTFGMEQTSPTGIDLSDMLGAFLNNVMLSIGVTETDSLKFAYRLAANVNILRMEQIQLKLDIYNPDDPSVTYISLYFDGAQDSLFINLQDLKNLEDQIGGFSSIGTIPKLKYSNLGLRDTLASMDIVGMISGLLSQGEPANSLLGFVVDSTDNFGFASTASDAVKFLLGTIYLSSGDGFINNPTPEIVEAMLRMAAEDEEEEGGFDIMAVIGSALSRIEIDSQTGSLSAILAANTLSALMVVLNQPFSMPEIRGHLRLQLLNLNYQENEEGERYLEDGYLNIYLALLDSGDNTIDALSLELDILKDIGIRTGQTNLFAMGEVFKQEDYLELNDFIEDLSIGLRLSGYFRISSEEDNYINDYINDMLAGLVEGLSLQFDLSEFEIDLGYEIVGNININDIWASEAAIRLYDRRDPLNPTILGIYLKNNNLYLELEYFGIPSFGISNAAKLIQDIQAMSASPESPSPTEGNVPSLFNLDSVARYATLDNPAAIAIQVMISPEAVSINLGKEVIAGLLALLLSSELPIAIKDTYIGLGFGDEGITFELTTGVEVLDLAMKLEDFKIALMPEELFDVQVPTNVNFNMSENGLPETIYFTLGGNVKVHSDTIDGVVNSDGRSYNLISLTPILEGLLPDMDIEAVIEFLGIVDGALFFSVEAGIDIVEIANLIKNMDSGIDFESIQKTSLAIQFATYRYDDPTILVEDPITHKMVRPLKPVMAVRYIDGELFIHAQTFLLNIEYIRVPEANTLIAELVEALTSGGSVPTDAEAELGTIPENTVPVFGTLPEDEELDSELNNADILSTYINIMMKDHGIAVSITKATIVGLLSTFGLDIGAYLDSLDVKVDLELSSKPLKVELGLGVKELGAEFFEVSLAIDTLRLVPDFKITLSEEEKALYRVVTELSTIGANLGGAITLEITAPVDGEDPDTGATGNIQSFSHVLAEAIKIVEGSQLFAEEEWVMQESIRRDQAGIPYTLEGLHSEYLEQNKSAIDMLKLLDFGFIMQIIDNEINEGEDATFGGTIYYEIDAIIDILNLSNLKLSFALSKKPKTDET
ncbi:MAG: hypothetical protein WCY33_02530, partial [Clostridia bacterium]